MIKDEGAEYVRGNGEDIKIILICLSVMIIGILYIALKVSHNDKLTEEEILELRELYPMSDMTCALGQANPVPLDQLLDKGTVCTFVYGEIIGDVTESSKPYSTGDQIMDDKLEKNGLNLLRFFEYQISVIEDTEGRYQPGDVVTIYSNAIYRDMYPEFSDGMKVIVPLAKGDEVPNRDTYGVVGMYYVTENGYAISAYDENTLASTTYSGSRVSVLLEDLKELIK